MSTRPPGFTIQQINESYNGTCDPMQYSCLKDRTDREAWQAMAPRVKRDGHRSSDLVQYGMQGFGLEPELFFFGHAAWHVES